MDFAIIKKEIDEWDPVDLLSHAPKDEYDEISISIAKVISDETNAEDLAKAIYDIFIESFGESTFCKSFDECKAVSEKILNSKT